MLDKILKRLKLITGPGITYGDKLLTVGKDILKDKFAGVYTEKDMPVDIEPNTGIIINKPINVHWIAQYKDSKGKVHTFDSYGRKMGPNPSKPPEYFKQHDPNTDCGSRAMAWLYNKLAM